MTGTGLFLGTLVAAAGAGGPPAGAMPAPTTAPMALPMNAGPVRVALADVVDPAWREAVLAVVRKPTLSTRGASDEVVCTPAVYEFLLDHPDRAALAWRRLKVPCVDISDRGQGRFAWTDPDGSELVWQTVGKFPEGRVWYASGKAKASAAAPMVPVKAVVVLTHPGKDRGDGTAALRPAVQAYLQTDSRAANLVLRLMGPTAPKLAEQGCEQLLFFFAGVARYCQAHPEKADELLAPPKR
ncbi:MAG: hypothetical protein K2X82_19300 [Gemmataceae bacterium]|nr:hypothetical protein [Gemmataceae bacterium]